MSSHFGSNITPSCSLKYGPASLYPPLPGGTPRSPHAVSLSTLSHSGPLRIQRPHTPLDLDAGEFQASSPSSQGVTAGQRAASCHSLSLPVHTACFLPLARVASLLPPPSFLPPLRLPDSLCRVCDFAEAWITHWPCCQTLWPWRRRWPARPRTGGTQSRRSCSQRSAQRRWTARPSYTVQNRKSNKHEQAVVRRSSANDALVLFASVFQSCLPLRCPTCAL